MNFNVCLLIVFQSEIGQWLPSPEEQADDSTVRTLSMGCREL